MIRDRLLHTTTTLDEQTAGKLQHNPPCHRFIAVQPPADQSLPATLDRFIRGITETQTTWLGLRNTSPIVVFEIVRPAPGTIRLRYGVPTRRLERKVRLHLTERLPEATFEETDGGLPVAEDVAVGGGHLEPSRRDDYPFRTDHDRPPLNHIVGTLHRHAMQDTRFVIQLLFKPVADEPLREWWRRNRAYRRVTYLRKNKEGLLSSRQPTPQERQQADAVEQKVGATRYTAAVRVLVVGAGDHTPSRVKEVAGAFNAFDHPTTGQGFRFTVVDSLRARRVQGFAEAVHRRDLSGYALPFQVSAPELAGMVALPDRDQQNITTAQP